jgi:hypothetical protein
MPEFVLHCIQYPLFNVGAIFWRGVKTYFIPVTLRPVVNRSFDPSARLVDAGIAKEVRFMVGRVDAGVIREYWGNRGPALIYVCPRHGCAGLLTLDVCSDLTFIGTPRFSQSARVAHHHNGDDSALQKTALLLLLSAPVPTDAE